MDLRDYFDPVTLEADYLLGADNVFGTHVRKHMKGNDFPAWDNADIALIGISEYRSVHKDNCADAANMARKCLYELSKTDNKMNIADLGNLREGKNIEDSLAALRDVMAELLSKNTIPLLLGGNRELTLAMFRAYEKINKTINLTAIDRQPGLAGNHYNNVRQPSYLSSIISSKSKHLFNYSNIGYQSYFALSDEIKLLEDMLFDSFRLGAVKENLKEMEPVIRDTDLLMISMSSIRQSDAPASVNTSPNGFFGEEVCQLAWYGGKSERLSSIAIFDWYGSYDMRSHTAHQAAQISWYFIDGFYKRKGEYPFNSSKDCTKYIVNLSRPDGEIIFYKSNRSERWWMEVPSSKLPKSLLVACSYEDYQKACRQELSERWWQNFKKINH
ncbi:MAG: arginase family protein [Bacteroidales bacterium]